MAKKSVDASLAAYASKGKKAPRPEGYAKLDPSAPPSNKGPKHIEPGYEKPSQEMASKAPEHKKKGLPSQDAPPGVKGVNAGDSIALPTHLNEKK